MDLVGEEVVREVVREVYLTKGKAVGARSCRRRDSYRGRSSHRGGHRCTYYRK
uniref:Uncharacterized protein n=1 Tax=Oryza meridionalis TaxID=40149 RepID=A0A0E0E9E7_9ORYZ